MFNLLAVAVLPFFANVVAATGAAPVAADYVFRGPFCTSGGCMSGYEAMFQAQVSAANCTVQVRDVKESTGLLFAFTKECGMDHDFHYAKFDPSSLTYTYSMFHPNNSMSTSSSMPSGAPPGGFGPGGPGFPGWPGFPPPPPPPASSSMMPMATTTMMPMMSSSDSSMMPSSMDTTMMMATWTDSSMMPMSSSSDHATTTAVPGPVFMAASGVSMTTPPMGYSIVFTLETKYSFTVAVSTYDGTANAPCVFTAVMAYLQNAVATNYVITAMPITCSIMSNVVVGNNMTFVTQSADFAAYVNCMSASGSQNNMPDALWPAGTIDPMAPSCGNSGSDAPGYGSNTVLYSAINPSPTGTMNKTSVSMTKTSTKAGSMTATSMESPTTTVSSADKVIPAVAAFIGGLFAF